MCSSPRHSLTSFPLDTSEFFEFKKKNGFFSDSYFSSSIIFLQSTRFNNLIKTFSLFFITSIKTKQFQTKSNKVQAFTPAQLLTQICPCFEYGSRGISKLFSSKLGCNSDSTNQTTYEMTPGSRVAARARAPLLHRCLDEDVRAGGPSSGLARGRIKNSTGSNSASSLTLLTHDKNYYTQQKLAIWTLYPKTIKYNKKIK